MVRWIANPRSLPPFLGAAAQLGIFLTFLGAKFWASATRRCRIGIIGGADGPYGDLYCFRLAPQLLAPIAISAYSYRPWCLSFSRRIMRLLTTQAERRIKMAQLRAVSKSGEGLFPLIVTLFGGLIVPVPSPLLGSLMLGELPRGSQG